MIRGTCVAVAAAAVGMLVTSACGTSNGGGGSSAPLQIGSPLALTGADAHSGELYRDGYSLCVSAINASGGVTVNGAKRKLQLVRKDDDSNPATSAQLTQQLSDQGIKLFLGPYGSPATAAAEPVIERNGDVMVNDAGASNALTSHGYTRSFQTISLATTYGSAAIQSGYSTVNPKPSTVAIVAANDTFSQQVASGAVTEAKRLGLSVVANLSFPDTSTDLSSVMQKARGRNPDIVLVAAHTDGAIAGVRAAHQMGMKPKFFVETVGPTEPDFTSTLGSLANGVSGTSLWVPQFPYTDKYFGSESNFVDKAKQQFGYTPDYHFASAVAGCETLAAAIDKANSADPDKVATALQSLNLVTVAGKVKFGSTGANVYQNIAVMQIQGGKQVTIWPAQYAGGSVIAF